MMKAILAALAILALVVACSGGNQQNQTGAPTGNVVENNATGNNEGAIGGTPAATPDNTAGTTNPGERENTADKPPRSCTNPVDYQTLVGALPKSLSGYAVQGEPEGTTLSWSDPSNPNSIVRYSTASETLTGTEGTVVVSLLDTCYVQNLAQGWNQLVEYQGSEGSMRKTTIDGYPGWVRYDKSTDTYTINLLVEDRIFVTVQGSQGVPQDVLEQAAKTINYDAIKKGI